MDPTQIAVSIATIGMSGVVSAVVTFRLAAQRQSLRLRQQKLESIHRAFFGYTGLLGMHWLPIISAMAGEIAYNDALGMTIKQGTDQPPHFARLEVLVAVYFPDLQVYLDELLAVREHANSIMFEHKRIYRKVGPHPTPAVEAMRGVSDALDELEGKFRRAVRTEAAKLNRKLMASR